MIPKGHGVAVPSYRSRTSYHAVVVAGFTVVATAALSVGDVTTRERIAHNYDEDLKVILTQVVPAQLHDNNLLDDSMTIAGGQGSPSHTVYRALKNNQVQALAYRTEGPGYSGTIRLMMAVDRQGEILGVRVLSHTETPGLGDKIEAERTPWIFTFNGRSLQNTPDPQWAVKKDGGTFDQFTGATITPRRTVAAVYDGLQFFKAHQLELLAAPADVTDHPTE